MYRSSSFTIYEVEDVDYQKVLMPMVEMCFAVTGRGPDTGIQ
jgi:hypothetical protein